LHWFKRNNLNTTHVFIAGQAKADKILSDSLFLDNIKTFILLLLVTYERYCSITSHKYYDGNNENETAAFEIMQIDMKPLLVKKTCETSWHYL